ncbi:hypothetical protein SAMN05216489_09314 [Streptomyces sp. 3213]|nr:hypothetical protein SAMN05216489_09314 [Streptomyces sp. 3213] [Streptomyces sp. 3213.3]
MSRTVGALKGFPSVPGANWRRGPATCGARRGRKGPALQILTAVTPSASATAAGLLRGAFSGRVAKKLDVGATLLAGRLLAAVGWLPLLLAHRGHRTGCGAG